MDKEKRQRLAKQLRKELEITDDLGKINKANDGTSEWEEIFHILDNEIFDKNNIPRSYRRNSTNPVIQELREILRREQNELASEREKSALALEETRKSLDMASLESDTEKAAKKESAVQAALAGEISGEELEELNPDYKRLKIPKPKHDPRESQELFKLR